MGRVSYAERRALCEADITLNGRPAKISGACLDYAMVTDRESGLGAEWSWPAVQRIVAKGGAFST